MMDTGKRSFPHLQPALSPDALYGKAAVYATRSLKAKDNGENDAYQLWATLALELLGKCALAHVHPSLVVEAKNSNSVLEACGISTATAVRTIDANEVFLRLKHVVPGFNALAYDACKQLADRRNVELHSGQAAYIGMAHEAWEGKLWHAVRLILQAIGRDLEDLIGHAASKKEALIEHLAHLRRESATEKVTHARETFELDDNGKKRPKKMLDALREKAKDLDGYRYVRIKQMHPETVWDRPCPACSSTGFLAGEKDYDELTGREDIEPGYEEVETVYTPIAFVCPVCGLELYGEDELSVANMDSPVIETEEREISYEPDYGND
jgi:hypothetical protein